MLPEFAPSKELPAEISTKTASTAGRNWKRTLAQAGYLGAGKPGL